MLSVLSVPVKGMEEAGCAIKETQTTEYPSSPISTHS